LRLLLVLCHYFGRAKSEDGAVYSSQLDPFARIAAVNAAVVEAYRHFGPRRHGPDPSQRLPGDETQRALDIVMLQVPGFGLLDRIGIDPACYEVEPFDGPPMMLAFEAQRVLRERQGGYDWYGVVEDDMILRDQLFFDKLAAFQAAFGPQRLLQATNYEMAQSGRPAMVARDPALSDTLLAPFRRPGHAERLAMDWRGAEQSFVRPANPHARSYFLSDAQLRLWTAAPTFYDRDASWVGPIESAMSLSIGRTFDLYRAAAPDPFFLSIQHHGTRYARPAAPPGVTYGDEPLLEIVHQLAASAATDPAAAQSRASFNDLVAERDRLLYDLKGLRRSRSQLFKALLNALLHKDRG
jgi:hypothetical protein